MKEDKLIKFAPEVLNTIPDPTKRVKPLIASGFGNLPKTADVGSIPQQINDLLKEHGMLSKQNITLPPDAARQYKNLVTMLRQKINNDPVLKQNKILMDNLEMNEKIAEKLPVPDYY